ncbi:MAG: hypothetical protein KKC51_00250 [Verrucomicrobia bacterium]|nr:hypothetical protein [Verrucomicrobiota bacterium]MBU1978575.1 hypothetical protein [Gammaproteobacteria bacterium]
MCDTRQIWVLVTAPFARSLNDYAPWPVLLSGYANPTQALVSIAYSASDPAGVPVGTNGYTPASGYFRLWRTQAPQARNGASILSGGDYIPLGTYAATSLGFSVSTRLVDLFIEPVTPGTNQTLLVEVDPDGSGPKGFVCVDKWQSTVIRIEDLDWLAATNEAMHHTDLYQTNALLLRRCDKFKVDVRLSAGYSSDEHKLWFEAFDTFDGSLKTSKVPAVTSDLSPGEWYAKLLTVSNSADGTRTAHIEINIPTNAAIGEYRWRLNLSPKDADGNVIAQKWFQDYVIVLFNPWAPSDEVYMADDSHRNEYVLGMNGVIRLYDSYGTCSTMRWRYAQFSADALHALLCEISASGHGFIGNRSDRSSATGISRHLGARCDAIDGGILAGKWQPPYTAAHKLPWEWAGSDEILRIYNSSGGQSARYGQCWVYAGLLTTLLRSAGIPARPLTNHTSHHDKNGNGIDDTYYYPDGTVYDYETWSFHAWCDAWMRRSDRPGHDGWQAVDGTPQEPSNGTYRMGPAPLSAIRSNAGGLYDVDFVYSEVQNRPFNRWVGDGTSAWTLTDTGTTTWIGAEIVTKSVASDSFQDIRSEYK